jgi:acetolactate synthase-1/2/3 large subunit
MWLARYAGFRLPNSHVSSGGLGTMGFALPAAMGAALGRPDRETWAITGDGGFQMTFQELMTLVQDRIPVKIALLRQQEAGHDPAVAGDHLRRQLPLLHLLGPDFAKLADAYGIPAFRARTPERSTTRSGRPGGRRAGADLVRDRREQNIFPMMPAGKGLSDLIESGTGPRNERPGPPRRPAGPRRPAPARTARFRRRSTATCSWRSSSTSPACSTGSPA